MAAVHSGAAFAQGVSDDLRTFAGSLGEPYCGPNRGFEAVQWLEQPAEAASLALMPLREPAEPGSEALGKTFGLLVLASSEAGRFDSAMGTDFLQRMAALASAALERLRD